MRAILINPENKTVTEVNHNDDYKEIYKLIDCSTFCCPVDFENGDIMYADDEGLFKVQKGGIVMEDWVYPILGKILILGTGNDGESIDAKSDCNELAGQITWLTEEEVHDYQSKF